MCNFNCSEEATKISGGINEESNLISSRCNNVEDFNRNAFNGEHGARLAISLTPELAPEPYHIRNEKAYRPRVGKLACECMQKKYLATDGSRFSRDHIIGFRGYIGKLRITDRFMNHSELIRREMSLKNFQTSVSGNTFVCIIEISLTRGIRKQEVPRKDKPRNIEIPHFSQTVCDNPTVASNYLLRRQHVGLLEAFAWDLEMINIRNTFRRKIIVFGCRCYINVEEYKATVGVDNENELTGQFGEILLRYDHFGTPQQINNLIHEIGHIRFLASSSRAIRIQRSRIQRVLVQKRDPCDVAQQFKNTPFLSKISFLSLCDIPWESYCQRKRLCILLHQFLGD
uniref:Uncharacterized protein n=1 Tax=Wuchereria bancrofti TaxID=6293 RepID=A0AAF5Q585_WUCBA